MSRYIQLNTQQGSMLLEGLIAILIFSFGILAIIGTQAASVRHTTDAKYRVDASFLANQTIGELWTSNLKELANKAVDNEPVSSLPDGKRTITVVGDELVGHQITVTITWKVPGETATRSYSTITHIKG